MYWKKVKSPNQREVVDFNRVHSIVMKIMQTAQVVSRAHTRERNKIADQVRLVEIALFQRQLCPVNRRKVVHMLQYALKPSDPHKQFWLNTHLEIKHINKSTVAESDLSGELSDNSAQRIAPNIVQRRQYGRMTFRSADQT